MENSKLEKLFSDPTLSEDSKTKLKNLHPKISGKQFSDICDQNANQYVDYVQEGGGVWGVALVGYLYALESFGIRFLRIAGTSAGAINTMLIASLGDHQSEKSEDIKKTLFSWNFAEFMDRKGFLKRITVSFIKNSGYLLRLGITLFFLALLILIFPFIILFLKISAWYYVIVFLAFCLFAFTAVHSYKKIQKNNIGMNSGNVFEMQMEKTLKQHQIKTIEQLNKKYNKTAEQIGLQYRYGNQTEYYDTAIRELTKIREKQLPNLDLEKFDSFLENAKKNKIFKEKPLTSVFADYTLITTDISTKIKVELPKMSSLYWTDEELNVTSPAKFVRASMAVPYFFEPMIKKVNLSEDKITQAWKYWLNVDPANIHEHGIFIDGGSISNFPIDIFHTVEIFYPRYPVFGVRLNDDAELGDARGDGKQKILKSPFSFLGNIINTLRGYNDKTFLTKYSFYSKHCIQDVNCSPSNWLNFYMDEKEKLMLFNRGFSAALDFLEKFDWEKYKEERMLVSLKERSILKEETRNDAG